MLINYLRLLLVFNSKIFLKVQVICQIETTIILIQQNLIIILKCKFMVSNKKRQLCDKNVKINFSIFTKKTINSVATYQA